MSNGDVVFQVGPKKQNPKRTIRKGSQPEKSPINRPGVRFAMPEDKGV